MSLIDERGRVRGRINVIDAVALVIVAIAIGAAFAASRSMRGTALQIESVTPYQVPAGGRPSLEIHGTALRPFLTAYVVGAGQPFALNEAERFSQQASYLVASPTLAEIKCPPELRAGRYDVYLYDEGQQIAVRREAFEVTVPDLPRGVLPAKVRFFVADETIPLIKVGDRDEPPPVAPNLPRPGGAIVTGVAVTNETSDTLDMHLVDREQAWIGRRVKGRAVDVSLRVPVLKMAPRSYQYTSANILQAGDIFTLSSRRYKLHGLVLWVGEVEEGATIAVPES